MADDPKTERIAERALDLVCDGDVVGLGSGRAAISFVDALGARVEAGLRVRGIPTSHATADLARRLQIPLTSLDEVGSIDVTIDGADEVSPELDLIKGYGGALVREKIVAAASKKLVILVGGEKLVEKLGERGKLPVEIVPFGLSACARRIAAMGYQSVARRDRDGLLRTDNGNHILDCAIPALDDPASLERSLSALPGVVGTGLFLGLADVVLIQHGDTVEVRERSR
jgi:ribose 5-phosphate isomerase A